MEHIGSVKEKDGKYVWEVYFYESFPYDNPDFEQRPIATMESIKSFDDEEIAKDEMETIIKDLGL